MDSVNKDWYSFAKPKKVTVFFNENPLAQADENIDSSDNKKPEGSKRRGRKPKAAK